MPQAEQEAVHRRHGRRVGAVVGHHDLVGRAGLPRQRGQQQAQMLGTVVDRGETLIFMGRNRPPDAAERSAPWPGPKIELHVADHMVGIVPDAIDQDEGRPVPSSTGRMRARNRPGQPDTPAPRARQSGPAAAHRQPAQAPDRQRPPPPWKYSISQ
jgi:hypothetical protein